MSITIFDVETKQDSPERLAAVANKPSNILLFAPEFNATVKESAQSAVDNISLQFSWSQKEGWYKTNVNGYKRVYLLNVKMFQSWVLDEVDKIEILIDRYRPKRTVRKLDGKFKDSGFKHRVFPDPYSSEKPSVIELTDREMLLDFGQEYYFKFSNVNNPPAIKAIGYGQKNSTKNRAWIILRFRLKVTVGDNVYYSKPKGVVEMIADYTKTLNGDEYRIRYKLKS